MAEYQIMYWNDIPAQVKAADATREVSLALPPRFQAAIDAMAMQEGLLDTDDYLAGWRWGELRVVDGTAEEVAQTVAADLNAQYPEHIDDMLDYILNARQG